MKGETLMTDVRAVIYVLKVDPDFATFDRDVARLGTWDEYTPAGFVVAKDATFAPDNISTGDGRHVLLLPLPRGERLNACQVMSGDGVGLGVTVSKLSGR